MTTEEELLRRIELGNLRVSAEAEALRWSYLRGATPPLPDDLDKFQAGRHERAQRELVDVEAQIKELDDGRSATFG